MCEIDIRNSKYTRNTLRLLGSGMKPFITFELKVFQHEERERDTQFLQQTRGSRSTQICLASPRSESQLSHSEAGTQLCYSQIPKILSASRHDIIHLPRSYFLSGNFYFDICEWHILPAHAWTPALMLHLTNPCTKGSHPN